MDHGDYCRASEEADSLVAAVMQPMCDVITRDTDPMDGVMICPPDQSVRVILMSDGQQLNDADDNRPPTLDISHTLDHDFGHVDVQPERPKPADRKIAKTCFLCNKNYASQFSLNRHLEKQHKLKVTPSVRVLQCPVESCESLFRQMGALRHHIRSVHRIALNEPVAFKFLNMEAFFEWKSSEQKQTHTRFVRPHGKYRRLDGVDVHQFYCHRSGYYCSEGQGLRRLKAQGSCKMGAVCPAAITCRQQSDGTVDVEYHNTHVGHLTDLEELYLCQEERARVNNMLTTGYSFAGVLDSIRNDLLGEVDFLDRRIQPMVEEADRMHALLADSIGDDEDAVRVHSLLQELTKMNANNPILFHRSTTNPDDTVFAIMSQQQAEILQRFGPGGTICIDDANTDEETTFDIAIGAPIQHLVIVSVLDDTGRARPCTFVLTNRLDVPTMTDVFVAIRNRLGVIAPRAIILHDAPHLEAWRAAMVGDGTVQPQSLLSTWQADATWRRQLVKVAGKPYQKAAVYKALRVLVKQPDRYKHSLLLAALQRHLTDSHYGQFFATYLKEMWAKRVALWALCYRDASTVQADMELESLHREVSKIFSRKRRKQVATTLLLLLWYAGRTVVDRSGDPKEIASRHRTAEGTVVVSNSVSPDRWALRCAEETGTGHLVERRKGGGVIGGCGSVDCTMFCKPCGMCSHGFSCSCIDAVARGQFCVHLHLVGRFLRNEESEANSSASGTVQVSVVEAVVDDDDPASVGVEQPFIIVTEAELTPELIDKINAATFVAGGISEPVEGGEDIIRREELCGEIVASVQRISDSVRGIGDLSVLTTINDGLHKLVAISQQFAAVD